MADALVAAKAAVGAAHARLRVAEDAHVSVLERGVGHYPSRGRAEREASERAVGKARRRFGDALAALDALESAARKAPETEKAELESALLRRKRRLDAGLSVGQLAHLACVHMSDVVGAEAGGFWERVNPGSIDRILAALDAVEAGDVAEAKHHGSARWMAETLREIAGGMLTNDSGTYVDVKMDRATWLELQAWAKDAQA